MCCSWMACGLATGDVRSSGYRLLRYYGLEHVQGLAKDAFEC